MLNIRRRRPVFRIQKGLSLILAILMIVSTMSATALAEGKTVAAEVVYNLGSQEITVGADTDRAVAAPWNYKLFDEDGSYTIQLEDNAFFPYEVQFKFGDSTVVEWFETPDSTVQVGGHTFRAHTEQNDDTKLSQIGVWVGGDFIAARPEPKTFTNNSRWKIMSLLPLTTKNVSLDLSALNRFQFQTVSVSAILSGLTPTPDPAIDSSAKVVWAHLYADDYEITEKADNIDLSAALSSYNNSLNLELIVGSALQLDDSNVRYIVNVTTNVKPVWQGLDVYTESGGVRSVADFAKTDSWGNNDDQYENFYLPKAATAQTYYIGMRLDPSYSAYTVKAIEGSYSTTAAAISAAATNPTLDVSSKILNQTLSTPGTGYAVTFNPNSYSAWKDFTLVFYDGANVVGHFRVYVNIMLENNDVYVNGMYNGSGGRVANGYSYDYDDDDNVQIVTCNMRSTEYPANAEYCLILGYYKNGSSVLNPSIDKAVLGNYNSQTEAAGQTDIKDQLFPETAGAGSGYLANYSGNGKTFTIFAEDEVHKITVKVADAPTSSVAAPLPNPGSSDTYFRVNGASGLSNVYVLPYEHDTYYDMGYQTVFYTDVTSPSAIKPTFWSGTGVNVYAGSNGSHGDPQISGTTERDFSNGPVQYAVSAENGEDLKNYWVTFVPKHTGGAKLFVNGVNGPDGAKREVFLTSIHSNAHDIFIANVGDAKLEGLNASLSDAQNIKLDPYWTVGGANNNSLAAFDSTAWTGSYSELANVAKIRLLPDGEGEIKGTLTITADGQEPVVITLTGNAGNPKLTTAAIPEAVKYVPYAVQILHNNKYPWNTVTMRITDGSLPAGVSLKPNGELYGVPREAGTFKFQVQMINSDTRFGSSFAVYTLTVNENTNTHVDGATDIGYEVSKRIGTTVSGENIVTTIADHEFITEGAIGEFMDFWLNGEKLAEDTDYTKEPGSTKITIKSQTFQNKVNRNGTNTISAEFRVDGDENKDLKRAAQNFRMDLGDSRGGGRNSDSSGGGVSSDSSNQYVRDQNIKTDESGVSVDLTQGSTRLSPAQTQTLITANQTQPVQINGNGYTITFPINSMQQIPGQTQYDFGLEITSHSGGSSQGQTLLALAGDSGVLALRFNHSGPLPGPATIRLSVGAGYAGQTLYYYYYNPIDNNLEYLQSTVVGTDGYVNVTQSHCSDYLLSSSPLTAGAEDRTFGQDRYLTAVRIAAAYFQDGASTVVLTRGDSSVDALPAVPLAKQYNAPLLLTPPTVLPDEVLAEIKTLKAAKVIIVGGPQAVSSVIVDTLVADGLQVERVYGRTSYDTAREVARQLAALKENTGTQSAVLVNGDKYQSTYADALSIAAWAGYHGIPILYADSTSDTLPSATAQAFTDLNVTHTILIGGTVVLPAGLEKNVPKPERYSGTDSYATNAAVLGSLQPDSTRIYAATGKDFADALAAAAVAARNNSWLVLTGATGDLNQAQNGLSAQQQQLLSGRKGLVVDFQVFGGTGAVPNGTLNAIKALIGK